jgi:ribosome maturation factor RimP
VKNKQNLFIINQIIKKIAIFAPRNERCRGNDEVPFFIIYSFYMQIENLQKIISKGIEAVGFPDMYLIEVKVKDTKIEIFLDSDEGITFLKCQKLSRWIEEILDNDGSFGPAYTLEVSSAGVGSPLKQLRQYVKNVGRFIEIRYLPQEKVKGTLAEVQNEIIVVTFEEKIKEGKKNKKVVRRIEIPFDQIIEAKIKLNL